MIKENDGIYYNWNKTMSYNAKINIIVSPRGLGKTYGLRKSAVKDFIKDGSRFVEVVRYKSLLEGEDAIQRGYFDKLVLNDEFPGYKFRVQGTKAYISKEGLEKDEWELIGYFVALSAMQQTKQRTFVNVKKVIFDEFIIDKRTRSRYLPGEFGLFSNLIDSLAREEIDIDGKAKGTKVTAYLLGNACDLTNPYFVRWKINKQPTEGYHWYAGKLVLLHYAKDEMYQTGKKDTLVGRLISGTIEEKIIIDNDFAIGDEYNVKGKSSKAKFEYGIIYCGQKFGVWVDYGSGDIYIVSKIPENSGKMIFALTKEDNTANYTQIRRGEQTLKVLMDMYYEDALLFESAGLRDRFLECMNAFGIN